MRPDGVVVVTPTLDQHFGLFEREEDFSVQTFVPGIVTALFDNDVTRPVFTIPVATFTNPNGLSSISGSVQTATDISGNPVLREAGDAGAGSVNAAALEASIVDLGQELTWMITTQRAYSSAAKVITTADDMLDELLRIKR